MKTINKSTCKDRTQEATFWEEHFDEAFGSGKKIQVTFAQDLPESFTIHLDTNSLRIVKNNARKEGIDEAQLLNKWILEKIGNVHQHSNI